MRLVAQRAVQPGAGPNKRSGINAFCYHHGGDIAWTDVPPSDLGRGQLVNRIVELAPPSGARVRSYLEITAPDGVRSAQIAGTVQSGASVLAEAGTAPPWRLGHGAVSFVFEVEAALAEHWQVELRLLIGYALAVRPSGPASGQSLGILSGTIFDL